MTTTQTTTLGATYGANGHEPAARAAARESLPPETLQRLTGTVKKQWKCYCKQLKRCQKKFSEEAVHDSRVETRRLLSMFELLSPFVAAGVVKKATVALKRHLDTFDELRDTQVQLAAVKDLRRSFPAAVEFYGHLLKCERRFTRQTRKEVGRIKTARLGRLVTTTRKALKEWRKKYPAQDANARLLGRVERAFERTCQLRRQLDPENTQTIHCTRVAFKRFRYMVEILSKYLPGADERLLGAMHDYQTMMGHIQDLQVLMNAFENYLRKAEVAPQPAVRLRHELQRRQQALIREYLGSAGQLAVFWPLMPKRVVSRPTDLTRRGPALPRRARLSMGRTHRR